MRLRLRRAGRLRLSVPICLSHPHSDPGATALLAAAAAAAAGLDLPAAPLFKDALEKVIIPQVPIFDILRKFDGQAVHEDIKAGAQPPGREYVGSINANNCE